MKKTLSLNSFRRIDRSFETLIRACAPNASAASPDALATDLRPAPVAFPAPSFVGPRVVLSTVAGARLVRVAVGNEACR